MDATNMKVVYVIANRNGKKFWTRVGVAFVNRDGSINVKFEALPVSGEVQIRDFAPRDELGSHRGSNGDAHLNEEALADLA